jgi:hypothetical protein
MMLLARGEQGKCQKPDRKGGLAWNLNILILWVALAYGRASDTFN